MIFLLLFVCSAIAAAEPLFHEAFLTDEAPAGWTTWAPRDEIAPRAWIDPKAGRTAPGSLALAGDGDAAAYGGWQRRVDAIESGAWYRLSAWYRTAGVRFERQRALARLAWQRADGRRVGREEYAFQREREGEWTRLTLEAPAPPEAAQVEIQLRIVNAPEGTVWWDDVSLEKIEHPGPRLVRVVSVNLRPRDTGSSEESVRRFVDFVQTRVAATADLIVLPEGVTVVGTKLGYAEVAEPIPGPTTQALAKIARAKGAYLVAGLYEREGPAVYNTAVLLDRQGRLVGKYRKVYLPREELDGGITPGGAYPVFATDFGRIGLMICWDVQYADPARALALRGAELIAMPIWGGNETLAAARAIENHVFLAASGYDHPTYVMDPMGERLSQAADAPAIAEAVIDLNRRYEWPWLGEMRGRFFHELRRDVPAFEPIR